MGTIYIVVPAFAANEADTTLPPFTSYVTQKIISIDQIRASVVAFDAEGIYSLDKLDEMNALKCNRLSIIKTI